MPELSTPFPPLTELLPHRPPMLLIDELLECDEHGVVCSVTVRADNPFVVDGRVPAAISLEYFAQSVAALYAWQHRHSPEPALGKLLGTRALELHVDYLQVGDALKISGREAWRDEVLAQFRCELHRGDERLASAAISVSHGAAPPAPTTQEAP